MEVEEERMEVQDEALLALLHVLYIGRWQKVLFNVHILLHSLFRESLILHFSIFHNPCTVLSPFFFGTSDCLIVLMISLFDGTISVEHTLHTRRCIDCIYWLCLCLRHVCSFDPPIFEFFDSDSSWKAFPNVIDEESPHYISTQQCVANCNSPSRMTWSCYSLSLLEHFQHPSTRMIGLGPDLRDICN